MPPARYTLANAVPEALASAVRVLTGDAKRSPVRAGVSHQGAVSAVPRTVNVHVDALSRGIVRAPAVPSIVAEIALPSTETESTTMRF